MRPEQKVHEAIEVMARYKISGVPVTRDGKAVGILTNRDLRFVRDTSAEVSSLMTREGLVVPPRPSGFLSPAARGHPPTPSLPRVGGRGLWGAGSGVGVPMSVTTSKSARAKAFVRNLEN